MPLNVCGYSLCLGPTSNEAQIRAGSCLVLLGVKGRFCRVGVRLNFGVILLIGALFVYRFEYGLLLSKGDLAIAE